MFHSNVNVVGTGVMDSALPWAQLVPGIAQTLAQTAFGNLSNIQQSLIQARASTASAATRAGATVSAAGISAQGGIDAQLIATNGAIAQNNAQMKADAASAAAGDIAAYRRLLQEQQYDAQLQDNKNKMEIAKLAGSGSLFDNIAARFASAGKGDLPSIGGAFGLAGGIQPVVAPTGNAPLSIEEILKYIPQASLQSGGGGLSGLLSGGGGGGGGFGGFSMPDIGELFSGLNETVFGSIQDFPGAEFITDPVPAPSGQIAGSPEAIASTQATFADLLARNNADPTLFAHDGAKLKVGESGITGDDPQGRLTPFSELIKVTKSGVEIIPLNKFRGGFHTGTQPHEHLDDRRASAKTSALEGGTLAEKLARDAASRSTIAGTTSAAPERSAGPRRLTISSSPPSLELMKKTNPRGYVRSVLGHNPTAAEMRAFAADRNVYDDYIAPDATTGVPTDQQPPVEPTTPPVDVDTDGILSDINELPALQALRGNQAQSIFSFGGPDFFSRPEYGIKPLPSPFDFGKNFLTMPFDQKRDVLQLYKSMFGLPEEVTLSLFQQSQPGFRKFSQSGFGF